MAARHGRYLAYRLVRAYTLPRIAAAFRGAAAPLPRSGAFGGDGGSASAAPPAEGGGIGRDLEGAAAVAAADTEEDRRLEEVFVGSALNPSGVLHAELHAAAAHLRTSFGSILFTRLGPIPPPPFPSPPEMSPFPRLCRHEHSQSAEAFMTVCVSFHGAVLRDALGVAEPPPGVGSTPLDAFVSKPLGQLLFLGIGCYFFAYFFIATSIPTTFVATVAAMVTHALRGGGPDGAAAGRVARFGLLWNGCAIGGGSGGTMINGTAAAVFNPPALANGYFFVTSDGPAAADPVKWTVWASEIAAVDASGPWKLVGASGWWKFWSDRIPQVAYPTPMARGAVVAVDSRWVGPPCSLGPCDPVRGSDRMCPQVGLARLGLLDGSECLLGWRLSRERCFQVAGAVRRDRCDVTHLQRRSIGGLHNVVCGLLLARQHHLRHRHRNIRAAGSLQDLRPRLV